MSLKDYDMVALAMLASVVYSMFCGIPWIVVFGAPVYALLKKRGWANLGSALALGVAPGLALLASDLGAVAQPFVGPSRSFGWVCV